MKKRLLSAFLALAMVLTLLPVSAFAAEITYTTANLASYVNPNNANDTGVGKTVTRSEGYDYTMGLNPGDWYWQGPNVDNVITIYKTTTGFINGTGNSGAWYPTVAAYLKNAPGVLPASITLLSAITVTEADSEYFPVNFTVDLNGVSGFTLPDLAKAGNKGDAPMTTLKLQNRGTTVPVGAITTGRTGYTTKTAPGGLTLTVENVTVASISLSGRTNTVTLGDKATVTGGVTMDGESVTSYDTDGTTPKTTAYAVQTLNVNAGANAGVVSITNSDGAKVTVTDGTTGTIAVTGNSGSVNVDGYATTGKITVSSRTKSGSAAVPTVTVGGGTVAGIERDSSDASTALCSFTIRRNKNNINISAPIVAARGNVTVDTATTQNITVGTGSLTISGSGNAIQNVTLAGSGSTDLTINATSSTIGSITATSGRDLNIKAWPTGRSNYYGTLSLGNYAANGVKGGTFAKAMAATMGAAANINWFDSLNLQFIVPVKNDANKVALYGKDELTDAISSIAATTAADENDPIIVLGQGENTADKTVLTLQFGGIPWAYIQYNATSGLILPTRINNTNISKWLVQNGPNANTNGAATGTSFMAGVKEVIDPVTGGSLVLDSTNTAADVTKITNVTAAKSTTVENKDVTVRLVGNTIMLSGAIVGGTGGYASIKVNLITDVVKPDGTILVMENVTINYDINGKKASFSGIGTSLDAYGAIVQNGELILNRGTGAKYTVSASLNVSASDLEIYAPNAGSAIVATIGGKISNWTDTAKNKLIEQLERGTFKFKGTGAGGTGDNRAMLEAINAAQATITSNISVATMIANTRQNVWKNGYTAPDGTKVYEKHNGNYKDYAGAAGAGGTEAALITADFSTAYIVPYLVVNVTDYKESGYMTATLTPYYRVDVSAAPGVTVNGVAGYNPNRFYTIQAGKPLSALTGDMSNPIVVTFDITTPTAAQTAFNGTFMHQDGKYVYEAGAGTQSWSIYHAGASGLGTIEINRTDGQISFLSGSTTPTTSNVIANRSPALPTYKYDDLQAAVNDSVPGVTQQNSADNSATDVTETFDTIYIEGVYKGNCNIAMTGAARKVRVVALGDLPIKPANQDVDVLNPSGYTYYLQLKRDAVVEKPKTDEVTIGVATAANGRAAVSASKAKAGEAVTVTVTPNTGYNAGGLTIRTDKNTTVSYTTTGTANNVTTYRFTVPEDVKSITVTPSFVQVNTGATVTVSSTSNGTATTSAGANRVAPGSTVSVTAAPGTGYRTMGLYVTSNAGNSTAYRTGVNTFTFTVPAGATNVVVTPRFDVNNGTIFEDVWSTEYYSAPVAWAVRQGVTEGTSTYTFSPGNSCTRAQMVTFLWRSAGRPSSAGVNNPFYDVTPSMGSDFYNAILWAYSKGITDGTSAHYFSPNATVSRAQAVTFLWRQAGKPVASTNSGFYDVSAKEYYAQAVTWAVNKGITNGDGSTTRFNPNGSCLRAQIVTFLYRNATGTRA